MTDSIDTSESEAVQLSPAQIDQKLAGLKCPHSLGEKQMSNAEELAKWCAENSSGAYRKSAEASEELRRLAAVEQAYEALKASIGEPVAYLWQHGETGRTRIVDGNHIVTTDKNWFVVGPLCLRKDPT